MKRSVKFLSVVLALTMIMSFCSCSGGGNSGRSSRDESGKPENQVEDTEESEEVTDTEETQDTEDTAKETEPDKQTYPLGSGVLTVQETVEICEQCIGMQYEDAVEFLMASMGVSTYKTYTLAEALENLGYEYESDEVILELTQFDRVPTIAGYPIYRFEVLTNIQKTVYQIWIESSDSSMLTEDEKAAGQQVVLNYPSSEAAEAFRTDLTLMFGEPEGYENPEHSNLNWNDGDLNMSIDWKVDFNSVEGQNVFEFIIVNRTLYISPTPKPTPDPTDEIKETMEFLDSLIGTELMASANQLSVYFGCDLETDDVKVYDNYAEILIKPIIAGYKFLMIDADLDSQGNIKHLTFEVKDDGEEFYETFTGPLTKFYGTPEVKEYTQSGNTYFYSTYTLSNGHEIVFSYNGFAIRNPAAT